jgi:hypothetical protein
MSGLCKYQNIFGSPGTGAHAYRFLNVAVVDVVGTVVIGWGLAAVAGWSVWRTICVLFLLGIVFHRLFCVRTTVDKILFT